MPAIEKKEKEKKFLKVPSPFFEKIQPPFPVKMQPLGYLGRIYRQLSNTIYGPGKRHSGAVPYVWLFTITE
jgi:hypothetical protein